MEMTHSRRAATLILAATSLAPVYLKPASAAPQQPTPQEIAVQQRMIQLRGQAISYYLFQRYMAMRTQAMRAQAANAQWPMMYRTNAGGLYYRNAQGQNVGITLPTTPIRVPAAQLQQFAPNYTRFMNGNVHVAPYPNNTGYDQFILSVKGASRGY